MPRLSYLMEYKRWRLYLTTNNGCTAMKSEKIKGLRRELKENFTSVVLAKRWIGRREALKAGRGRRKPKPKGPQTKRITVKHSCIKQSNKTFSRMRFGKKRDSVTYITHPSGSSKQEHVIIDCPDKTQDWWELMSDTWVCATCSFSITRTEVMNTYFVRKVSTTGV